MNFFTYEMVALERRRRHLDVGVILLSYLNSTDGRNWTVGWVDPYDPVQLEFSCDNYTFTVDMPGSLEHKYELNFYTSDEDYAGTTFSVNEKDRLDQTWVQPLLRFISKHSNAVPVLKVTA